MWYSWVALSLTVNKGKLRPDSHTGEENTTPKPEKHQSFQSSSPLQNRPIGQPDRMSSAYIQGCSKIPDILHSKIFTFLHSVFVCFVCFLIRLHGGHVPHISEQGKAVPFLKAWITLVCTNKLIVCLRDVCPVFTLAVKT